MAWNMPYIPNRPVDIYTVRISSPQKKSRLLKTLRGAVETGGGTMMIELVESKGFIFSIPPDTPNPLTSYVHARWLEEGSIRIIKTTLDQQNLNQNSYDQDWLEELSEEDGDPDGNDDKTSRVDEEELEHPNLRMQWTWSERKDESRTSCGGS